MKRNISKVIFYILYIAAVIFLILFAVLCILTYNKHQELLSIPYILVAPYTDILKSLCVYLLIPSMIFGIAGFILQKLSKKE